jgi:UDP-N-acetylmuramoylalanine--D-glutamate ligase
MKIAIVGYGSQGRAAFDYWQTGNEITIFDSNPEATLPVGVPTVTGTGYLAGLDAFDLIIRSPGIHPRTILAANQEAPTILGKVTTVTNEFLRVCPTKHIIAVTGTKGKGTTSTLITKLLEVTAKRVHLGGNIGIPPLNLLQGAIQPDDVVVLELANFQLIDLKYSPSLAVCLMVAPEHLDWHGSMEDYLFAKQQLFRWQTTADTAIFYADNDYSRQVVSISPAQKVPYMKKPGANVINGTVVIDGKKICQVNELGLLGQHNWQNVCAAVTAVWNYTQDIPAIRSVLTSFAGLPFRIEFRREIDDVRYYNDSFASAPPASLAAIASVTGDKVIILGGYDRGLDLTELTDGVIAKQAELRKVILIGQSGPKLAAALQAACFTNYSLLETASMVEIVHAAKAFAQSGDAIILSPGFASFDMFKNFEDRGRQFNEAVAAL